MLIPLLEKARLPPLPAGISVFFPSEDGLQDIMYRQDFGLSRLRPAFRKALSGLRAAKSLRERERLLLHGYLSLFLEDYEQAASDLKKARALWPDSFWPRFLYAAALWLRGDQLKTRALLPETFDAVNRALELKPDDLHGLMIRAIVRREMEDEPGRLRDIEHLLRIQPSHVWARVEHVEILGETGRTREGLKEAGALIREFPEKSWAWAHRSRVHGFAGRYIPALDDLDRAIKLDPCSGAIRSWRAEVLRRLGRYQEALKELRTASRLDGGYAPVHIFTGRIHLQLGNYAASVPCFNRALKEDSREVLAAAWRAEAYWKLGNPKKAFEDFARIHPTEPRFTWNARLKENQAQESLFFYGAKSSKNQRQNDFWADLDKGVALRPSDSWAWAFRGRCKAADSEKAHGAIPDLTEALRLNPKNHLALAWRGEAFRRMGKFQDSKEDLKNSLNLNPHNRWVWAWNGRLSHQMGLPKKALACYARALKDSRSQHLAPIWVWMGEAHEAEHNSLAAARAFIEAVQLNGKLEEAFQGLRRQTKLLENTKA